MPRHLRHGVRPVSPGYFPASGILFRGRGSRDVTSADRPASARVAVVNEAMELFAVAVVATSLKAPRATAIRPIEAS
ncbi:MAG: hypothetical protein ABJC07_12750 [Acidobacteriota bacterium]